jgi:peptidoglycan/xylan/chitin deacetylase (PgdA/CDA1 family)
LRDRPPVRIVPVLLYHSISRRASGHDVRWTVSPATFSRHVETIASSCRTALTVSELGACLRGERALPQRAVVVTFDDGYADVVGAAETLAARGLASTIYVTTGQVGHVGMLSRAALSDLGRDQMVEVGAHGSHHDRLDELARSRIAAEVRVSKIDLEDVIQMPVTSFAYPHGAYDRRSRDAVITAGYQAAAAVKNALSHPADDPFAIARWTVRSGTSEVTIGAILEGRGAPLAWNRERARTKANRAARRLGRLAAHVPGARLR